MMAKYRIGYAFLLAAALLLQIFLMDYLSSLILLFFALLPFLSQILTQIAAKGIAVSLQVEPDNVKKGDVFSIHIRVQGRSRLPLPKVRLSLYFKNAFASVGQTEQLFFPVSRTERKISHQIQSSCSGRISCTCSELCIYDFLGLTARKKKHLCEKSTILVLPDLHDLNVEIETDVNLDVESEVYSQTKSGDDPAEIFGIRSYRSGDRPRSIHWKLSEKQGELMVKEFSRPVFSSILLLLDLTGSWKENSTLVEVLYSLSFFLAQNQIWHTIQWYDSENQRYFGMEITDEDSLTTAMHTILMQCGSQTAPLALEACNRLAGDTSRYPHAIYLTGSLDKALLTSFCDRPHGLRTSIILASAPHAADEGAKSLLYALGAELAVVHSRTIEKDLNGFAL